MSRRSKIILIAILMIGAVAFSPILQGEAITATTAGIHAVITNEDGKTEVAGFSASSVTVKDAAYQTLEQGIDYTLRSAGGSYTVTGLAVKQTYHITFTATSGYSMTLAVPVTSFSTSNKVVKAKFVDRSCFDVKKVGVLGGVIVDDAGAVLKSVTVKAVLGSTTYTTTTNSLGAYKLHVPIGKYSLIVVGKDSSTDYKNTVTSVNVVAGLMCGPITDPNAATTWTTDEEKLGLTVDTINGSAKVIAGVANAGAKISAFTYDDTTQKLSFLASANAAKATAPATTGVYKIALPECQPGKRVIVRAEDAAGNIYDNTTYKTTPVALNTMTLTADSTDATTAKPIVINFADSKSTTMTSFLKAKITSVTTTISGSPVTLKPTEQYSIGANKITINPGVLGVAGNYTIKVVASGYNEGSVTQTIVASNNTTPTTPTSAPTFSDKLGFTNDGIGILNLPPTVSGNSYRYTIPNGVTYFKDPVIGDDVSGWKVATDKMELDLGFSASEAHAKYVYVAEVNTSNIIVKVTVPSTANILDYRAATKGFLTGTVAIGPDQFSLANPDVVSRINGQDRTITITFDGGTVATVNFSSEIELKTQLVSYINDVIAVSGGPGVAQYDTSGHIQIISVTAGATSKVRIGGKDAALFFGTSPTTVDGTSEAN